MQGRAVLTFVLGPSSVMVLAQVSEVGPASVEVPLGCQEQLVSFRYVLYIDSFRLCHMK